MAPISKGSAGDEPVLIPRFFRRSMPKLSLDDARTIVGEWLAFTRQVGPRRSEPIPTPPLVTQAYILSNKERELSRATRKKMTAAASAVSARPNRTLESRLQPLLGRSLPDGARIVLSKFHAKGRKPFAVAFLECPDLKHPGYVTRFKASYSKVWSKVAYNVRGHGARPPGPKTHDWKPVPPAALPALPAIARDFISAIQSSPAGNSK